MGHNFVYRLTLTVLVLVLGGTIMAQEADTTGWKKSLTIDALLTQAAYSDSWTGGEVGSYSWASNLNGSAERQFSPRFNIRSTLKLKFGQTAVQNDDKSWNKPKKSSDLIDWESVATLTMKIHVDPYAAFRLESQFMDASFEPKRRYFSPLKLTESAGLSHRFYERDKDHVTSRAGLALRQIFKNVIIDSVAVTTEDSTHTDGGIEWVTDAVLTLSDKLKYTGKLTVYKAFFSSGKDEVEGTPQEDYWKAIDINWENQIDAQLSKIITVVFYTQVLYDKEIDKRGRFKEVLGIGFKYTIF